MVVVKRQEAKEGLSRSSNHLSSRTLDNCGHCRGSKGSSHISFLGVQECTKGWRRFSYCQSQVNEFYLLGSRPETA
jgi:hypothetical protein